VNASTGDLSVFRVNGANLHAGNSNVVGFQFDQDGHPVGIPNSIRLRLPSIPTHGTSKPSLAHSPMAATLWQAGPSTTSTSG
jgi:hypothetical protein